MKIQLGLILLLILGITTGSQAQFSDDFTDGNFTANPVWNGQTTKFEVNAQNQLHLMDGTATSPAYLSTGSQAVYNASWEFYVKLDFDPSTSNYAKVALMSTSLDLTAAFNGYYVKIGGATGTVDDVSLYRQDGTGSTKIIDGIDGTVATSPELKIKVTRDSIGNWELYTDATATGNSYVSEGFTLDATHTQSSFFGVHCIYTSTRSDKFYFDDFVVTGTAFQDNIKPTVSNVTVNSATELEIKFSEFVEVATAVNINNYTVDGGIGNPQMATIDLVDSSKVILTFSTPFTNGNNYNLTINNVEDRASNVMNPFTTNFLYFIPATASFRDVVINELFPDPSPVVGLPEKEFIELYNTSNEAFDLNSWTISDGSSAASLSTKTLAPNEYIIICATADVALFQSFGTVMGVSSFPTLNNSGDFMTLKDNNGVVIDQVNYTDEWYNNATKKAGGYTLEQINPTAICGGRFNWTASNSGTGGTPGTQNSVFSNVLDQIGPELLNVLIISSDTIVLEFNETLDSSSVLLANYVFDQGNSVGFLSNVPPLYQRILIGLNQPLQPGVVEKVTVSNLTDCSGNLIGNVNSKTFSLPEQPKAGDIILNEVLFNPRTGGSDFIEVYNNSQKAISLQGWKLANSDSVGYKNIKEISAESYVMLPGEYTVLTTGPENIKKEYPLSFSYRFLEMGSLPSMNDSEGNIYLLINDTLVSDFFLYNDDMHLALLTDLNGVSLERISFDRPTNDEGTWHSASSSVGYATPTYKNSQYFGMENSTSKVSVSPEVFSPDNDGFEDLISFNYQFDNPGYIVTLNIYDAKGRLIKNLANNNAVGASGNFIWDGINDNNSKAAIGAYVLIFEAFTEKGDTEKFKKTFVLGGRL
jgi:hypothetical protein